MESDKEMVQNQIEKMNPKEIEIRLSEINSIENHLKERMERMEKHIEFYEAKRDQYQLLLWYLAGRSDTLKDIEN